jgi:hypothetical protein
MANRFQCPPDASVVAAGSVFGLVFPISTASAEVCDKVIGGWWDSSHGSFDHEWLHPSPLVVLLPVAAAFTVGSSFGSRIFALVLIALSGLLALNDLTDPIALSAIREGCLKPDWRSYRMASLVTAAAAISIVVFRFIRYSVRVKSAANG